MAPLEYRFQQLSGEVLAATAAAREALRQYDPPVRALAVRQLSVEVDIYAAASIEVQQIASLHPADRDAPSLAGPWTPDQIAERMQVTRGAVDKWMGLPSGHKHHLRKIKAGKRTLITREDLDEFLSRSAGRSTAAA